jgi:hypothetical protein
LDFGLKPEIGGETRRTTFMNSDQVSMGVMGMSLKGRESEVVAGRKEDALGSGDW